MVNGCDSIVGVVFIRSSELLSNKSVPTDTYTGSG